MQSTYVTSLPWHEVLAVDSVEAKALENDFLQLYRCCHIKQTRAAHAMDDEFIRYRNTNLRHHPQITLAVTMKERMQTTRAFETVLVFVSKISRNQVDIINDINLFLIGPSFVIFLLIHAKNARYDWKVALRAVQTDNHTDIQPFDGETKRNTSKGSFKTQRERSNEAQTEVTSRLINGSADSRQDSDNFSSYSGAREAAACEWCGGPRGAFCKQINSFVASCIRTCLCIKCCCRRCDTAEEKYRR